MPAPEKPFSYFAFLWVCYESTAIEYAAMPLLLWQKKPLIDFVYALSVSEPR
jgi:hypothetical protein